MLKLNNIVNSNDSNGGGGGGGGESTGNLIKMSGYADNASYIDLAPNDPASLKSVNSDVYCSFYLAQDGIENSQDIFYIEKVCGIGLSEGQLKSWNWETMSHDTVIESPTPGVRYDLKCEIRNDVENTTRKWYRKIGDTWTAIADAHLKSPQFMRLVYYIITSNSCQHFFKLFLLFLVIYLFYIIN